jgi:hypothetical protein
MSGPCNEAMGQWGNEAMLWTPRSPRRTGAALSGASGGSREQRVGVGPHEQLMDDDYE